jgi:LysM repeat protein
VVSVRRLVPLGALVALAGLLTAGGAATTGYRVQRGDTLGSIARRHGTTVEALAAANGIRNHNLIRAGATLKLPTTADLPIRLQQSSDRLDLVPHFDRAAAEFGVPADLLKAVAWLESGWQNDRVSPIGARGIGQLMPATVEFVNDRLLAGAHLDPGVPADNIRLAARFLRYLLDRTDGDPARALAAYYQGLRSVREIGPKPHTVVYVADVLALRKKFS